MRRSVILLICVLMLFTACAENENEYYTREIYSMNTVINVNVAPDVKNIEGICNEAVYYIYELEAKLSANVKDSAVSKFNSTSEPFKAEEEFLNVMHYAIDIANATEGAYDPTVLPLTRLWNVTEGGYLPTDSEVAMARSNVDHTVLSIEADAIIKSTAVCVDLGGIAKGYALGKVVRTLSEDVPYGMVSFGGNVGVWGEKPEGGPWEIGIKNPFNPEGIVGKIITDGGYVSVSGDYERYFEVAGKRYHHIFDPKTGYPADSGLHSVAVYTTDAAIGDALSTALFVMGYDKAIEFYDSGLYDFEALFITDNDLLMTKGMEEMFTYEN
ncbi:MAG: FAD:protein FMN transferase [Clostridia bacterium]|nr:FAD:protein FMN transferase [Clostridia bacterium]